VTEDLAHAYWAFHSAVYSFQKDADYSIISFGSEYNSTINSGWLNGDYDYTIFILKF
jgi:hypothetical protein